MTAHSTAVHSAEAASHPRSRLRARLVLAALSACGLAALAWASFGLPKPRLIYNPSDSVPVGWYRVDPSSNRTDSLPRPLSVDSIVLVPLPAEAAALAAQRGYLPTRIPLLKRVGAMARQEVCIADGKVRIDGVPSAAVLRADRLGRPLPSWRQCRRLRPGELFLLSVTNPDGYRVNYEYTNDFRVPRVSKVSETGQKNAPGQELKISYENGNTTIFEEPGLDGQMEHPGDNKKTTWHFDNMGRPTDVLDADGFANNYSYYTSGMKNHKLSKDGSVQKTVYGLLRNPTFDPSHGDGGWYTCRMSDGKRGAITHADGYIGTKSAKLTKTELTSEEGICQAMDWFNEEGEKMNREV